MKKEDLRACWFRLSAHDKWRGGYFHQWGTKLTVDGNNAPYTVAIVESNNGSVHNVLPENIDFGSTP
jgi:hypothetical protein